MTGFDKCFRLVRLKSRGGLQTLVPQTGEVYKPARPGPAGDLNNSLRLLFKHFYLFK